MNFTNPHPKFLLWLWILALGSSLACQRPTRNSISTAEQIRDSALAQAKKEGKAVLLVFGQPDGGYSDQLDAYHADPEVHRILREHFVLARIDIVETPGGEHYYHLHGGARGAPAFSLLDDKGMLLADSGEGEHNVGFPTDMEQIKQYLAALKTAAPKLSEDQVSRLRERLESLQAPH